jgi:hypothetical protein
LLLVVFLIAPTIAAGQDRDLGDEQTTAGGTGLPMPQLPPNAEQVAREIGILPLVERVRTMTGSRSPGSAMSIEELSLRQQITEAVLAASLDADDVIAEISYEQDQITGVEDRLSNAKNSKVNSLTLASIIVGSGSSAIGTGMGFSAAATKPGYWVQVVGGVGGIVLSILALRAGGGTASVGVAPNMLAPLLGREPETSSVYPRDVWTYLNTVPAGNPRVKVPWKEDLISEWVKAGRIGPVTAAASQPKIDRLTSGVSDPKQLSIGDLSDRKAMLADLRSRISLLKRDLRDLTKALSSTAR